MLYDFVYRNNLGQKVELNISVCLKSYPCQHYCKINGEESTISGLTIYRDLVAIGYDIPEHFGSYQNFSW